MMHKEFMQKPRTTRQRSSELTSCAKMHPIAAKSMCAASQRVLRDTIRPPCCDSEILRFVVSRESRAYEYFRLWSMVPRNWVKRQTSGALSRTCIRCPSVGKANVLVFPSNDSGMLDYHATFLWRSGLQMRAALHARSGRQLRATRPSWGRKAQ